MGYTHYWERPTVLPRERFAAAVRDCQTLCSALNIPLGDGEGQGEPVFSSTQLCFNGHVASGQRSSIQQVEGLVWPRPDASGVAVAGQASAVTGGWGAGPAVTARMLGPGGDGSYETFCVDQVYRPRHSQETPNAGFWFACCKTNYRPYDLCVQGCLLILQHHLTAEQLRVSSDGHSRDWNDARSACQHVLGYGLDWGEGDLSPVEPAGTAG